MCSFFIFKIHICGLVKVIFEYFSMLVEVWEDVRSMQALWKYILLLLLG